MGHGGYGKHKNPAPVDRKKPAGQRRPKSLAVDKKSKAGKAKSVTFKNQIRSIERMLRKVFTSHLVCVFVSMEDLLAYFACSVVKLRI